jgi:hypothetical protein
MKKEDRLQALADAMGDEDSTLACEACRAQLAAYVEAETEGTDVAERFPVIWRHLLTCDACGELYADLLEVTLVEESEGLPPVPKSARPDLSFLPSRIAVLRHEVEEITTRIVREMKPQALGELTVLCDIFFERIEALDDGFQINSAAGLAMAFGSEASPALPILASTYKVTTEVMEALESDEVLSTEDIKRLAQSEARRLGMNRSQAKTFANRYLEALPENLLKEASK